MGLLYKFYKHNGWIYYKKIGTTLATPAVYLPLTAENFKNQTVLKNQINGEWLSSDNDIYSPVGLIHTNPNALFAQNGFVLGLLFFGNSVSVRIKPIHIKNRPLILCVLYDDKSIGDIFVIALLNMQIVTYYFPQKNKQTWTWDQITAERVDTGIYLEKDRWTSLGFNFHGENGYGLAGIYMQRSGLIDCNITPLKSMQNFCVFSDAYEIDTVVEEEMFLESYKGGLSQLKIYRHNLTDSEFTSDLENFNDDEDQGQILCDLEIESGNVLALGMSCQ